MGLKAIAFLPRGIQEPVEITDISKEDLAFFDSNNARVSVEYTGGHFIVYADLGFRFDLGDTVEAIEISKGRGCRETLSALRKQCEKMIAYKE